MSRIHLKLITAILTLTLSSLVCSEAPVVDESENYAMLNQQQGAGEEQPLANEQENNNDYQDRLPDEDYDQNIGNNDHKPLARDNASDESGNISLLSKIQALQQDIQELRGQIEVQAHDLKLLQQQQLAFYKDLDARLNSQSSSTNHNSTINTIPTEIQPMSSSHSNPADEQLSYLAAYELVKNKKFDEAIPAMQEFVQKYPKGGYTANAQYWLGELYLTKKNYPQASFHFEIVLRDFPNSNKSADCLLKLGYALAESGNIKVAKQRLEQVIKQYPDTSSAQLAKERLTKLRN